MQRSGYWWDLKHQFDCFAVSSLRHWKKWQYWYFFYQKIYTFKTTFSANNSLWKRVLFLRLSWAWSPKNVTTTAQRGSSARKACLAWRRWLCSFCRWQKLHNGAASSRNRSRPATRTKITSTNWSRSPTGVLWKTRRSMGTSWRFLLIQNRMSRTASRQGRKIVFATSFCKVVYDVYPDMQLV